MKLVLFTFLLLITCQISVLAQSNQSWIFISHTQKISDKFDVLADIQTRSNMTLKPVSTLLLRGALAYNLNQHHSLALGYAYKGDWEDAEPSDTYMVENRIYQQYQADFAFSRIDFTLRGRFEQRFVKEQKTEFSMRARAFISVAVPLIANDDFSKGLYAGIQDEIFLNVYKKNNVNNHFLDQNRPYVSLGYRFSKTLDTSFDYGLFTDQGPDNAEMINVYRISVTTSF